MVHAFLLWTPLSLVVPVVHASIYPTEPVQATVWTADRPMWVRWQEDGRWPALSDIGRVEVGLWVDTDTYLLQLASDVDPMTKGCQVTVPGTVLKQGSKYTLRFTMSKPVDMVIYSADFVIVPANTTTTVQGSMTGAGAGRGAGNGGVALATQNGTETGIGTGTESGFRTVVTGSGSFSWTGTATATNATAMSSGSLMTPGPSSGTISGGGEPSQGQRTANANAGRKSIDVEKLKFRFVFVIWPVLMGITMAL